MASELTVQTLRGPTSGTNADTVLIPSGQTLHAPGHVIQVIQNIGSVVTTNSSTPTTVASASITIQSTNKVYAACVGDMNSTGAGAWNYYQIYRDSTAVGQRYIGQAENASHNLPFSNFYLDQPGSSGTYTYSLKCWQGTGSMVYGETGSIQAPTMVLMEIAQ
jgi:hypothetical protein